MVLIGNRKWVTGKIIMFIYKSIFLGTIVAICDDPTVSITQTDPQMVDRVVEVKEDVNVTMDCVVKNLPANTRVRIYKLV